MNIQRFTAPTSREALAKARLAFGDGTLILSNRPTASGVEVVATAEDALAALDQTDTQRRANAPVAEARRQTSQVNSLVQDPQNGVEEDAALLAMSTLSFQDYVRERMLRRRHEALNSTASATEASPPTPKPASFAEKTQAPRQWSAPSAAKKAAARPAPASSATEPVVAPGVSTGVAEELQSMRAMIEERFNTLNWLGQARQHPIQSGLMLKLIRAGYSPTLARSILEKLPEDTGAPESMRWVMDVLERNLRTDAGKRPLYEEGGVYALVGSTGVGKTTTAAKLAGLCAQKYGPASVGLITLDTFRIGAHEQLRSYGRMMGIVAHLAHDRAALQDLLGLLAGKKMVLVDTMGIAPRDPRKKDMLDLLALPSVNRLLVLNAGGQGDMLEDVVTSFKSSGIQQAVLSKIDEAVKLGPALDATIRHQLVLRGIANGQRVPEDWEAADAGALVRASMRAPTKSVFDPVASDIGFYFTESTIQRQAQAR